MKMQCKAILIGMEVYKSAKTQKEYAKVLFVDEGGTEPVTCLTNDFTIMKFPLYTPIKAVFDYNARYKQLDLIAYEQVK